MNLIEHLKVGDEVAIRFHGFRGRDEYRVAKVDKITKVGGGRIHVEGDRYYDDGGEVVGKGYSYSRKKLVLLTEEIRFEIIRARNIAQIESFVSRGGLEKASYQAVMNIAGIVDGCKEKA